MHCHAQSRYARDCDIPRDDRGNPEILGSSLFVRVRLFLVLCLLNTMSATIRQKSLLHGLCTALDASKKACNLRTKEGSLFCPRHDEASLPLHLSCSSAHAPFQERKKLYLNYKAHHTQLDSFPEESICRNPRSIRCCLSLDEAKAWNKALTRKYQLLNRLSGFLATIQTGLTKLGKC